MSFKADFCDVCPSRGDCVGEVSLGIEKSHTDRSGIAPDSFDVFGTDVRGVRHTIVTLSLRNGASRTSRDPRADGNLIPVVVSDAAHHQAGLGDENEVTRVIAEGARLCRYPNEVVSPSPAGGSTFHRFCRAAGSGALGQLFGE